MSTSDVQAPPVAPSHTSPRAPDASHLRIVKLPTPKPDLDDKERVLRFLDHVRSDIANDNGLTGIKGMIVLMPRVVDSQLHLSIGSANLSMVEALGYMEIAKSDMLHDDGTNEINYSDEPPGA